MSAPPPPPPEFPGAPSMPPPPPSMPPPMAPPGPPAPSMPPTAMPVQPMSMQAHIQAQIQFQAAQMQQAQQAQMLQAAQFQAQLQAQAQMRAFMQPPGPPPPAPVPAPPRAWGSGKGAGKTGGPRPLTAAQRQIRDGDFQVQRAAGQKAAEQVQEALELSTWAQKQLAKASQQAELVLEKATQSQDYQQKSRMATAEGSLEVQQQQVWMQQLSNELFNEAASIGDQILAQAESAIGTTKSAVIKVLAACDPLQALAKKHEEATRVSKSQQLAQQAEQQAERGNLPAVELSRDRLQSARDDRDRGVLIAACQQVKMTVVEATTSAALVFQAVQLAQQAAPAIRTAAGDGSSDGTGFYSFSSSKAVITTTMQKPLPGPDREVMPIDEHRDEIVRTIRERRVTCIQGETGCGKSSRVPQYVYHLCRQPPKRPGDEKLIVCTQPRRLAALTLSQRVAKEMGEPSIGGLVGFRISGESVYDFRRTRLLFVTTGYLLQVLVNDPGQIHKYSHIILDEAHERSVDADLLSLVLKLHIQHKLADFKLIIMSATLQGGVFSRYFQDEGDRTSPAAPIFVGVKRFHLDILYLDDLPPLKTRVDTHDLAATTLEELRQRTGLHLSGPAMDGLNGGLEGFRNAINAAQRRAIANPSGTGTPETAESEFWRMNSESGTSTSSSGASLVKPQLQKGFQQLVLELVRMLGCGGEGVLIFLPGINEISELFDVLEILEQPSAEQQASGLTPSRRSPCEFKIFMLHSTIPMDEQEQAFQAPAENVCHVFLASNIAESSVTLPKVRVVIDTCLRRQLSPDKSRHGVNCLMTQWVSHASASQRSGRAGRVYPGVSIRLVPRSFYTQHMAQYDAPEIEQAPLEKLYLNVKQLSQRLRERLPRIGSLPPRRLLQLTVQPPPMDRLEEAVGTLAELGALTTNRDETARITVLGRMAISLPLDLRLCRLILFGVLFGCAADAVVMATALGGQDPFTMPMSIVIKDHVKYARAVMRSLESRWHFDAGALSEPIMLRNLFKAWLKGLGQDTEALGTKLRFTSGSSQRHVFVKHAHDFAKNHAVMPKRLTQLALSVVDVAQRTLEFLAPNESEKGLASPSRLRLEGLLMSMGIQPERSLESKARDSAKGAVDNMASQASLLKLEELFSEDLLLLKTTLMAAFTPLYAHGIPRCVDYTSIAGPEVPSSADDGEKVKKNSNLVMLKADPQLAKVHTQALSRPDVEPKSFFCIPQVPEALTQQPATDTWSFSMRELLTANNSKFKKLQVSQGQAFLTYESTKNEEGGVSEESEDEEIRPPDTLIQDVHDHMQLPPLDDDLSGDDRRPKRPASSSESTKRKRRRAAEEAQQNRAEATTTTPEADATDHQGQTLSMSASGEWQWSTAAIKPDESDEDDGEQDREERDVDDEREKERKSHKEKERRKDKERHERDKKSKRIKLKKKKEESSSESESDSSERSRRKKKKKKEGKRKKKSRSRKKKRREGACLEIESSSSGDLEIVAEEIVAESGSLLALPNAATEPPSEATMETAFEEVTEEQREKQRRRLERFRAMQAKAALEGDEDEGKAAKRMELKGAEGGASVLAQLKAKADSDGFAQEPKDVASDNKSPTSAGEESDEEAKGVEESEGTKAGAETGSAETSTATKQQQAPQEANSKAEQSTDGQDPAEAEEEEGSPVDVNEPDLRWERKAVTKTSKANDGPKRGVQFGGAQKAEGVSGASPESDTELFQEINKKEGAQQGEAAAVENNQAQQNDGTAAGATESQPGSDTELFQDLKKDEFANFLDEIKELDAPVETPGTEVEALLKNEEESKPPAREDIGLKFKEPQDKQRAVEQAVKKEEVKKEEVKEEAEEMKAEVKEEESEQMKEINEEMAEVKEEASNKGDDDKEDAEEKDEMDAFLDDIKDVEDKGVEEKSGLAEASEETDAEKPKEEPKDKEDTGQVEELMKDADVKAHANENGKESQEQESNEAAEPQEPRQKPSDEDEEMAFFLSCLGEANDAQEGKQEDMDVSSEGKDDSTALSTEGTPRAMTEGSAEDDFAAFLGALDEMDEKKGDGSSEAPAEAEEEADGLDDLPVVEIKRRLRSAGGTIPDGPEDKEKLVALLRETLNKPKGDAFMDFLSEIDKIHPATAAGDVEMKDSAFADFLKEIAEKPAAKPLRIRYEPERRTWVVFVATGFDLQEFPADSSPIEARRKALDFCYQKVTELETEEKMDEREKAKLQKLILEVKAQEENVAKPARNFGICRGLDFPSMHLLIQFGNGKNTFQWPVKVRQSFPGSRQAQSYTAEVEQKFELHRPVHPFQLAWRVCLDHGDASSTFGIGNFRSPAGLVISCPSKSSFQHLQKNQAKHAMEAAVAQRKLEQEQQRFAALLASADSEEEAAALKQRMAEETKSLMADAAKADLSLYTRCARRLERLAVFSGAQGREDSRNLVQLEGLTVLPNEDGSNVLPVLLLLAFFRPRTCGGAASGGCAALCDLDRLQVRAVSMFGHAEESRWVLPITGKRKLSLDDLQTVNELRRSVSDAFEVADEDEGKDDLKDKKERIKSSSALRMYIKELPEITKALGLLLGAVGKTNPFDEAQTRSPDASAEDKARFLGDVWIDMGEDGPDDASSSWEQDHVFVRWDAPLPSNASGTPVFLSFEDLGKEVPDKDAVPEPAPKAETDTGSQGVEARRFAFLPELSISQDLKDRADSFRSMQSEAREVLSCGRPEVRSTKERVKHIRRVTKMLDGFQERSKSAWTAAMKAEDPFAVKQAMNTATKIMQDLSTSFAEVESGASFVREIHQKSESRKKRAESCNAMAPHIWATAVKAARLIHEKLSFHWRLASAILKHADASKRSSYKKADDTVRLVNEKLLRWKEEAEILQQEAREDEMARQASMRQGIAPRMAKMEAAELARQRQDLERQRAQAMQWGRHLVQPLPMQTPPPPPDEHQLKKAVVPPPAEVPPPPPGQTPSTWVPPPPGPPN